MQKKLYVETIIPCHVCQVRFNLIIKKTKIKQEACEKNASYDVLRFLITYHFLSHLKNIIKIFLLHNILNTT